MVKITLDFDIPAQRIADLFATAFEGGSEFWVYRATSPEHKRGPWYSYGEFYENPDWEITLCYDNPEVGPTAVEKTIRQADVERGLWHMARQFPTHFGDFMTENDDAGTADIFLQCVVFGELVFG